MGVRAGGANGGGVGLQSKNAGGGAIEACTSVDLARDCDRENAEAPQQHEQRIVTKLDGEQREGTRAETRHHPLEPQTSMLTVGVATGVSGGAGEVE